MEFGTSPLICSEQVNGGVCVLFFPHRSGLYGLCQDWKWEDCSICAARAAETVRGPVWHLLPGAHSYQVSAVSENPHLKLRNQLLFNANFMFIGCFLQVMSDCVIPDIMKNYSGVC